VEYPRRIIIDPMWEYHEGVLVRSIGDLAAYVRPLRHYRYAVVLRGSIEDALAVCELATAGEPTAPALPGCLLVIDELDKYCSPHFVPDGLMNVINYGRHYSVSFIGVSRRPKRVHRDVTANADEIICYQTQEPGDVRYLAEFIGEDVADRLSALPPHVCISSLDERPAEPEAEPSEIETGLDKIPEPGAGASGPPAVPPSQPEPDA
jgi:hypothetical protein